jgi:hypothetical protein
MYMSVKVIVGEWSCIFLFRVLLVSGDVCLFNNTLNRYIHDHSPTISLTDIYMTTHQQYP